MDAVAILEACLSGVMSEELLYPSTTQSSLPANKKGLVIAVSPVKVVLEDLFGVLPQRLFPGDASFDPLNQDLVPLQVNISEVQ